MGASAVAPGTVTLMGSGEFTPPMSVLYREVMSDLNAVRAAFLDTPAGFQLNADEIAQRAVAYFRQYLNVKMSVASFKSAARATPQEVDAAIRTLRWANLILAGPGSPTYAIWNWRNTAVFETLARRIQEGAQVIFASAAAIAVGRVSIPVYEIYKVGEDPHWLEGLDLLGPYGLDLAIVPHWNNAEGGTHDTRFVFLGEPRFRALEEALPESTVILGIDEYTTCRLNLAAGKSHVHGAGKVTLRHKGREVYVPSNQDFDLDQLLPAAFQGKRAVRRVKREKLSTAEVAESLRQQVRESQTAFAKSDKEREVAAAIPVCDLALAVEEARRHGAPLEALSEGEEVLRQLLLTWLSQTAKGESGPTAAIGSLVEILISVRSKLRAVKQFSLADEIRKSLSQLGVILEDQPEGTTWRLAGDS